MGSYSKIESQKLIKSLVEHFGSNINSFKSPNYKEAQVENDFIRPFFQYLNWNTTNIGLEPEREVFQLQVTGRTGNDYAKRPDYLIRVPDSKTNKMKSCFFIEAKKPVYDLQKNVKYIRQVYRYAWSTLNSSENPNNKVKLALLTDFEEFRFFDCSDSAPLEKKNENRSEIFNKHVLIDWVFTDYAEKFDELWDTFEYNNVVNGSLEKWFLTDKKIAENRVSPDKKFLVDLKQWRIDIARSMYKNNNTLSDFELTRSTLLFINRIIFVKMLADRNIEPDYLTDIFDRISKSKKTENKLYELCKEIFDRLDHIYNGSMFAYDVESDEIEISNVVLKSIFEALKPENSVYTLAAMPVEIIGNVYELFIAEQINKKGTGLALVPKYDEKKAGGVYYTPRYIVEYIVDNTLGKKLEECTSPEDVAKLKILDPACGSGSFLIVAYQRLLEWHKKWLYNELLKFKNDEKENLFKNKFKNSARVFKNDDAEYYSIHLSHKLKSDILINNIFGVDIDAQAVLVTKFSLSIKALEDSTHDEVIEDITLFKMPTIPKLENNIKCGNSLIGSDFYIDNRPSLFNEKEKRKINTFDWEKEFPQVFIAKSKEMEKSISKKIDTHFNAAVNYLEGAQYHTEKAIEYADELNNLSVKDDFQEYHAGYSGGFDVIIGNPPYVRIHQLDQNIISYLMGNYKSATGQIDLYTLFIEKSLKLLNYNGYFGFITPRFIQFNLDSEKIRKFILNYNLKSLTEVGKAFEKVNTECLILIVQNSKAQNDTMVMNYSASSKPLLNNIINQNNFRKFPNSIFNTIITFDENRIINKLNNFKKFDELFGLRRGMEIGKNDIRDFKSGFNTLLGQDVVRYHIEYEDTFVSKNHDEANRLKPYSQIEKILIRRVANKLICVYDDGNYYFNKNLYSAINKSHNINLKYLLGLLNSKLINFYLKKYFTTKKEEIFPEIQSYQIKSLPIRIIDFTDKSQKQVHDRLVKLVEQMMENQKYLHEARNESDKKMYKNITDQIDRQIDEIVYKLYDLTNDEIKIIEEGII